MERVFRRPRAGPGPVIGYGTHQQGAEIHLVLVTRLEHTDRIYMRRSSLILPHLP